MPFVKGHKKIPNSGIKKGENQKKTAEIKEAFKLLIENNLDNMTNWLEDVAKEDPYKALNIIQNLAEYIVPKLARTELSGKDGKDLIPFNIKDVVKIDNTSRKI